MLVDIRSIAAGTSDVLLEELTALKDSGREVANARNRKKMTTPITGTEERRYCEVEEGTLASTYDLINYEPNKHISPQRY